MHSFLYFNKAGEISFHSPFKKAFLCRFTGVVKKNIDCTYIISNRDNLNGGICRAMKVELSSARR
jgi:hypothetical protein